MAMLNFTAVNQTVTTSGNTDPLDTAGLGQLSFSASVSSVTGSGAYVQVEVQASDDGTNFNVVHDTRRMTTTDIQRISGIRMSGRYYRFAWFVGGSTPSATLIITATLKDYSPTRTGSMFRYDDLDLKTGGATSTVYNTFSNTEVGVMMVRGNDTSSDVLIKVQGSQDGANWHDHTGSFTLSPNQTINKDFSGCSHRFFRLCVDTAATGGSTATCHALWNSTGGA